MSPPDKDSPQPYRYQIPESLTGVVGRITYHAEESGYTVARLQSSRVRELVTVVGNFKQYKTKAIVTVKENPYQLAGDIYSIGFLTQIISYYKCKLLNSSLRKDPLKPLMEKDLQEWRIGDSNP